MELHILGNRAGTPLAGHPSSGYLVRHDGAAVLLECGYGVTAPLWGLVEPEDLTAVVVSHLHADHCFDLFPVARRLLSTQVRGERPPRRVPFYVQPGGRALLDGLTELFRVDSIPVLNEMFTAAVEVIEYEPSGAFEVGPLRFEARPVRHALACSGMRISAGDQVLAFSGDTGPCDALVDLARHADMFLCEATLRQPEQTGHGHLCAREAGEAAAAAGARHLVLTHVTDPTEAWVEALAADARAAFPGGRVSVAEPGATIPVGAP